MPTTSNYGWTEPTVGGSTGAWGDILNSTIDAIDSDLKQVSDEAGGPAENDVTTVVDPTGTHTFDLSVSRNYIVSMSGAFTVAFSNVPTKARVLMRIYCGSSCGVTWPGSIVWPSPSTGIPGGAPGWTVGKYNLLELITLDGGTSWVGVFLGVAI